MDIAIYIYCSASYAQGFLYGTWVRANQSAEALQAEIQAFLAKGPAPHSKSWWIDGQRGFYGITIPREAALEKVAALAAFMSQQGELGAKLLIKMEGNLEKAQHCISECFIGKYRSIEACVHGIFAEINTDIENPAFDLSMASDIFRAGCFVIELGDYLYVFSEYSEHSAAESLKGIDT
jgi:antirestriction protein